MTAQNFTPYVGVGVAVLGSVMLFIVFRSRSRSYVLLLGAVSLIVAGFILLIPLRF